MSQESISSAFGKFVWYDQMSHDLEGSGKFYRDVVGWTLKGNDMNDRPYTVLTAGETMIGGLMPIPEDAASMGARPTWMGYVAVDDVDGFAGKVTAAGGLIYRPPSDIPNIGRFAVVGDPGGAAFIIFKGEGEAAPAHDPMKPMNIGWHELHAGDLDAAFAFYSGLFGWTKADSMNMGPLGVYQMFNISGAMAGGMMTKTQQMPAPTWIYYINVEGAEAAAGRVKAGGGQIVNGPIEVPGGQWVVQALDPQGAIFGLVAPRR